MLNITAILIDIVGMYTWTPMFRVSESDFTSKQSKKVIYGREKHRKRRSELAEE